MLVSDFEADFEPNVLPSPSYCHFGLAVGDEVRLRGHVARRVDLLYDTEFLRAVALIESQHVAAVPGSQPSRTGSSAGAAGRRLGAQALGAPVLESVLLRRQLSGWAVRVAGHGLHAHGFHGEAAFGCHLQRLSSVAVVAVVSFLC